MAYLLNVTVAWIMLLVLFELLYKQSGRFIANRIYLLGSIVLGLLLPFLPLSSPTSQQVRVRAVAYTSEVTAVPIQQINNIIATPVTMTTKDVAPVTTTILLLVYGLGVAILLTRSIADIIRIQRLSRRSYKYVLQGYEVYATGSKHTPFSFIGRIFLPGGTTYYTEQELDYILKHETAHNEHKHWIDLLIMQLVCTLCWFHPLVWRYRYLLKLQHEYEADRTASGDDAYRYGHFLLRQTLMKGAPSIAHSFHFSPIKNRIAMLTGKHLKYSNKRYLFLIPALLGCSLLVANTADKNNSILQDDQTSFKGYTLTWRKTDTAFYDKASRKAQLLHPSAERRNIVTQINDEPVYQNEYLSSPASWGNNEMSYPAYLRREFNSKTENTADSLTDLIVVDVVVGKDGRVLYYDLRYPKPNHRYEEQRKAWDPLYNPDSRLNKIAEKLINEVPRWQPAYLYGQPVNSFVSFNMGC